MTLPALITLDPNFKLIETIQAKLCNHRIFQAVWTEHQTKEYMHYHVWCVWDFMYLLNRLRLHYSGRNDCWTPSESPEVLHTIYSLCLTEEVDISPEGSSQQSHLESFLQAMEYSDTSTKEICSFLESLKAGSAVTNLLETSEAPEASKQFTRNTLDLANESPLSAVAAFTFGRELTIPGLFSALIKCIPQKGDFDGLIWYIKRHIYIDTNEHSAHAEKLLKYCVHNPFDAAYLIEKAAVALEARLTLLDRFYVENFR